jgi:hypothetical protein
MGAQKLIRIKKFHKIENGLEKPSRTDQEQAQALTPRQGC